MDDQSLETRTLRYFVAVVENLHFSRAADQLGVSQSALSVVIQRLETRLGVRLLARNKRQPVSLTDAGKMFHTHAVVALQHIDRADQVGKLAARGLAGIIRIGYVGSGITTGILQTVLRRYREAHPSVRIEIIPMDTPTQIHSLDDAVIDIGILRARRTYPEGVESITIQSEPLVVALADNHPLCLHDSIVPEHLQDQTFIVPQLKESEGFHELLAELEKTAGFRGQEALRVKDFMSAIALAAAGYGVVLAPESILRMAPPGVAYRPIEGFNKVVHLALAYRTRANSPATLALINAVREMKNDASMQ
jgi:DNA-binding transcriptional LysR family regulator